ncbi:MAG TPA: periplasmic heavy metal sensor [Gemmatimonadales bacterium]|nr:periplasmic heavy metal sensor [Gemmatimonadales bacterium]
MFNRSKVWAVMLLVAVFVVGGASGWSVSSWRARSGRPERGRGPDAFVAFLTKQISLTPVQQDSVRAVLVRHKPEMDAMWRDVHARVDSLRHVMRGEIFTHLTPAQRDAYTRLMTAQEHQRQASDSARDTTPGGRH